jgi:hypothetical protein
VWGGGVEEREAEEDEDEETLPALHYLIFSLLPLPSLIPFEVRHERPYDWPGWMWLCLWSSGRIL